MSRRAGWAANPGGGSMTMATETVAGTGLEPNWFETFFDEHWLVISSQTHPQERSAAEVEFLIAELGLETRPARSRPAVRSRPPQHRAGPAGAARGRRRPERRPARDGPRRRLATSACRSTCAGSTCARSSSGTSSTPSSTCGRRSATSRPRQTTGRCSSGPGGRFAPAAHWSSRRSTSTARCAASSRGLARARRRPAPARGAGVRSVDGEDALELDAGGAVR